MDKGERVGRRKWTEVPAVGFWNGVDRAYENWLKVRGEDPVDSRCNGQLAYSRLTFAQIVNPWGLPGFPRFFD